MKLEDQVTSLELSKRLKELGAKQDSLFYWMYDETNKYANFVNPEGGWVVVSSAYRHNPISAFTVSELSEMLHFEDLGSIIGEGANAADACATILIYLIEKGIVKP